MRNVKENKKFTSFGRRPRPPGSRRGRRPEKNAAAAKKSAQALDKSPFACYNLRMNLKFGGDGLKRSNYRTEGRERLLRFLAQNPDRQFTAEEICRAVNGGEQGKSSVYRQLSGLCREDAVRCFPGGTQSGRSVYQVVGGERDCRNHFHAKCVGCGRMEHLECDDSSEFARHLLTAHGFDIDCGQSLLYGLCAECRRKRGGNGN